MSLILIICKILGAVLTAAGAGLKLIKDLSRSRTASIVTNVDPAAQLKHNDKLLKIEINLIVGGLVISVLSISAEQFVSNRRVEEARIQTSKQLHEIRRLVDQIRTIDIELTIPLVATNEPFLGVRDYLASRALVYRDYKKWKWTKIEEMYRQNPEINVRWHSEKDDNLGLEFYLISDSVASVLQSEPSLRPVQEFLQAFGTKASQLRFCYTDVQPITQSAGSRLQKNKLEPENTDFQFVFDSKGNATHGIDFREFLATFSPRVREAQLQYDTSTDGILLLLKARFPIENWERLQPTISFSDISRCSVFVVVPDLRNKHLESNVNIAAQVVLDGTRVFLRNIRSVGYLPRSTIEMTYGHTVDQEYWSEVPILPNTSIFMASVPELNQH